MNQIISKYSQSLIVDRIKHSQSESSSWFRIIFIIQNVFFFHTHIFNFFLLMFKLWGVQQRFSRTGGDMNHVKLSLVNNATTSKGWPTCAMQALLYYCYYWSSWSNWISWFMAPATRRSFPWLLMGGGGEVWERCVGGRRGDDFWGWHWCLTGLRGAVKTKPLINAIDQQKNRGKCDLHTARVINALTDFFFLLTPPPPLKSDFLSFQSEREREFRLMWIDWASLRQEYKAFY